MIPLQPKHEIVFGTPTTFQGDQIQQGDLIVDYSFTEGNLISFSASSTDRQLVQTTNSGFRKRQVESRKENDDVRRVMHRDVERKRRQEMSDLYASLRSCVPIEHNKGKTSVVNLIEEAVDYIKQKQTNIQELRIRRDKLKKLTNSSGTKFESSSVNDLLPDRVMVNRTLEGHVEILISCGIKSSEFGLSGILAEVLERELDVVSSVSTRTREGFLHKIHIEARNITSLDVLVLQDRFTNAIKQSGLASL